MHNYLKKICGAASRLWQRKGILNPFPVYFMVDSTDCDHCNVRYVERATCGYEYLKIREHIFYWAEGPTSVVRVTRKDFKEFESSIRDYAAEAFENGHPHIINYS